MPIKNYIFNFKNTILPGILNSYSIIFFLNNKLFAVVLMIVSFFNFYAGLSGLYAVVFTIFLGNAMNLDKTTLKSGIYSFNGLLTGIGMGTFFDPGVVFFSLLTLATILSLFLSVSMGGWLYKYRLPHLSIPFVISFWFVMLPASNFENLGLTHRNIYWLNEMYAMGGNSLINLFQYIDNMPINKLVDIYLRSLSSIFFQSNLLAGFLIAIALLIGSRILFSLSIVGFLTAYLFAQFTGSEAASITYYNIGANYMMVAFAIGGFFLIPSKSSYLWTVFLIPLTSLVLLFFYKLLGFIQLPIFSLPFSFVVILFVYFLQLRSKANNLNLTPVQHYSPEVNLYSYKNNKDRWARFLYFPLHLPFWGEWTVTQGYNGEYTHLGEWGKALDFMMMDSEGKTYKNNGLKIDDYYCYNKPIVAPADGIVELVIDNIEDNAIGKINTIDNWGNSIIIKHAPYLYSQISHLKKSSAKVKVGDYVTTGDLLSFCGNSGRSPEPHLHFQLQTVPTLGSKTLEYPFSYYFTRKDDAIELTQFSKPLQGEKTFNITTNQIVKDAFDILPNSSLKFAYTKNNAEEKIEQWDAYTDAYNYKYLYCAETESTAYYVNDGYMFYFTAFYGDKNSLLYFFYLSTFKVFLGMDEEHTITDMMPLNTLKPNIALVWLQDFVAPFFSFVKVKYEIKTGKPDNVLSAERIVLNSIIKIQNLKSDKEYSKSKIIISEKGIYEFNFQSNNIKIQARCIEL